MGSTRTNDGVRTSAMGQSVPAFVGACLLIPGCPQWVWRQRERSLILAGSFFCAVAVAALAWGSRLGSGVLFFAFLVHSFSAVDAIRQYAFPGYGKLVPIFVASTGLGIFCYVPTLWLALVYAWPVELEDRPREGYLVNRWAYQLEKPRAGQTVWLRPSRGGRAKVARILAGSGQRVEWSGASFRVDDQIAEPSPFRSANAPAEFQMTIPDGHLMVSFGADPKRDQGLPGGWEVVDQSTIRGRAWALSYPIWERRLLN